jgi:hypothetical protein
MANNRRSASRKSGVIFQLMPPPFRAGSVRLRTLADRVDKALRDRRRLCG